MGRDNYKKLGNYIEQVSGRNKGTLVTNLMGISYKKVFIPSIANIIGTDLSTYRIIKPGDFAFCPVTSRNGDRITIARYCGDEDCIISQAYLPFRVKDEKELNPEYLLLWVKRPEFDRYARFHSHGSVREIFSWDDMCNVLLPVPKIDIQNRIVSEYQSIEKRIENHNLLINALEKTAQNIFRLSFYKGFDSDTLPDGWYQTTIKDYFGNVTIGKTPPRENTECFRTDGEGIKWVSIADMNTVSPYIVLTEECLTEDAVSEYKVKIVPKNTILLSFKMTVGRVSITTEDMCTNEAIAHFVCKDNAQLAYTYYYLKNFDYTKLGNTSSISDAINSTIIKEMKFIVPERKLIEQFAEKVSPILEMERQIAKENLELSKVKALLLSKIS